MCPRPVCFLDIVLEENSIRNSIEGLYRTEVYSHSTVYGVFYPHKLIHSYEIDSFSIRAISSIRWGIALLIGGVQISCHF